MPRMRPRRKPEVAPQTAKKRNAIVAAVSRVRRNPNGLAKTYRADWQVEAWRQFDINGALAYACNWIARSMSRVRITVVEIDEHGRILGETDNQEVLDIAAGLIGNPAYVADLLYDIGVQLFVPGDMHVIAAPGADEIFRRWIVASTDEITIDAKSATFNDGSGNIEKFDLDTNLVFRVHNAHPRKHYESTSPTRVALPTLRKLEELNKYLLAVIQSRLAGSGILAIPSELEVPVAPEDIQPGETPFIAALADAMLSAIDELDSPDAVVPLVVQGPADVIDSIKWIISPLGELRTDLVDIMDRVLRHLAVDMDVPAEVIMGSGEANRYNVWQIEEQAIKLHIEPKMTTVVRAFTEGFLIPALDANGIDASRYAFWYDAAELTLRPDRSTDAKDVYDRGGLSLEALRRETGFSEDDAPTGIEAKTAKLLRAMALSPTASDALVPVLLDLWGFGEEAKALLAPATDPGGTPADDAAPDPNANPRQNPTRPTDDADPPVARPSTPGA